MPCDGRDLACRVIKASVRFRSGDGKHKTYRHPRSSVVTSEHRPLLDILASASNLNATTLATVGSNPVSSRKSLGHGLKLPTGSSYCLWKPFRSLRSVRVIPAIRWGAGGSLPLSRSEPLLMRTGNVPVSTWRISTQRQESTSSQNRCCNKPTRTITGAPDRESPAIENNRDLESKIGFACLRC